MDTAKSAGSAPESKPDSTKARLAFAAIGVVFGDIGTSPLYAMREALHASHGDPRTAVLGVVSLLIWALLLVVTLKYVVLLMRADNKGEGGILSLVVLTEKVAGASKPLIIFLGIIGAAFFFGDAMITPAMSVLSALEGLTLIDRRFEPYIVPVTLLVLTTLFAVQYRGTEKVAALFAPVTAVWFLSLALMGLFHIGDDWSILKAFSPHHGVGLLLADPHTALLIFGGVFLAVTGGEALYADMGHFGRGPIRMAWSSLVAPALILNYLGQGAFVQLHPEAAANPLYLMAPGWALIPLVLLATAVTVIASQAVITGAFSIAQQAMSLGLLPRMSITHTSETEHGQIYVGQINWMIYTGVVLLVLLFGSSSKLASAYGIAVNTSMIIDSMLALLFFWHAKILPRWLVLPLIAFILVIECVFLAANSLKILAGGYVPVLIGLVIIATMLTWLRGREVLMKKLRKDSVELEGLLTSLEKRPPTRVAGAAVFLQTDAQYAPSALMHNLKHNRVLHDRLVFITIETVSDPRVLEGERVTVSQLPLGAYKVQARFGYMEQPDVPRALRQCEAHGLDIDPRQASYFMGRRAIRISARSSMPFWQQRLFIMLTNQSARAIEFFRIPPDRVVELGMQLSL